MCDDLNKCVRMRNMYELRLHYSWETAVCMLTHRNRCVVLIVFLLYLIQDGLYQHPTGSLCMKLQLDSRINMLWKCVSNLHNLTFLMRQQRTLLFYEQEGITLSPQNCCVR